MFRTEIWNIVKLFLAKMSMKYNNEKKVVERWKGRVRGAVQLSGAKVRQAKGGLSVRVDGVSTVSGRTDRKSESTQRARSRVYW